MKKIALILCLLAVASMSEICAQLPAVTLKTIDGQMVRIDTLNNDGKPFIIDFFATWCKPCLRELDAIAEVYDEWQEETDVKIFCVSIDKAQNAQKVKPLVNNHGWTYDVMLDSNEELKRALGVQTIPYTMVIDGNGKIVSKHVGYTDGAEQELLEEIRELADK